MKRCVDWQSACNPHGINQYLYSMSSSEVYSSTCQDLMERLIDTVPNDVVLSSPIQAIDQKIYQIFMGVNADDTVNVHVQFRVRISQCLCLLLSYPHLAPSSPR